MGGGQDAPDYGWIFGGGSWWETVFRELVEDPCEEETVIIFAQKSTNLRTVAGIPQAVRMKISGNKTDSMERRYNIVDTEDLSIAKEFMERRMKAAEAVTEV